MAYSRANVNGLQTQAVWVPASSRATSTSPIASDRSPAAW